MKLTVTSTLVLFSVLCAAKADDAACTNKDFRGVYAFYSSATNVTNNMLLTFAGSFTANGEGKITAWKDQAAIAAASPIVPPNFKTVSPVLDRFDQAKSLGGEILYTVEPDCRIRITATFLGPTGAPSPQVWTGALASAGAEVLLMNASPESPYLSVVTVKRASKSAEGDER